MLHLARQAPAGGANQRWESLRHSPGDLEADASLLVLLASRLRAALIGALLARVLPALPLLALGLFLEALVALAFLLLVARFPLLTLFVRHGFLQIVVGGIVTPRSGCEF